MSTMRCHHKGSVPCTINENFSNVFDYKNI